jgi:7,8-dihydroneopterin aldolase/epimerase/oxygenase
MSVHGDRLFLRGLTAECIIGVIDWERQVKQTVLVDLELPADCAQAALTDEMADTLDYSQIAQRAIAFIEGSQFKLIESLGQHLAERLITELGLEWVRISLHKPGALRDSREVGVTLERTRADIEAYAARKGAAP